MLLRSPRALFGGPGDSRKVQSARNPRNNTYSEAEKDRPSRARASNPGTQDEACLRKAYEKALKMKKRFRQVEQPLTSVNVTFQICLIFACQIEKRGPSVPGYVKSRLPECQIPDIAIYS